MNTSGPKAGERVSEVRFTDDSISVDLFDGRTITVPLAWYPRLLHATPAQDMASIGRISMKILAPTAFCMARRRPVKHQMSHKRYK